MFLNLYFLFLCFSHSNLSADHVLSTSVLLSCFLLLKLAVMANRFRFVWPIYKKHNMFSLEIYWNTDSRLVMLFSLPKLKCKIEQVELGQQWNQALALSLQSMSVH